MFPDVLAHRKYEPAKVSSVEELLVKYSGKEESLFKALVKKYGPEPTGDDEAGDDDDDDDDDDDEDGRQIWIQMFLWAQLSLLVSSMTWDDDDEADEAPKGKGVEKPSAEKSSSAKPAVAKKSASKKEEEPSARGPPQKLSYEESLKIIFRERLVAFYKYCHL